MNGFQYYTPTKVVFGKDTERQAGALVREFGGTKVLVHYGKGSVKRSGLLDRVFQSLDEAEIPWVELGGAVPNPHLSLVHEGIGLCKKEGVDFILAVGGGSAIDSAKAIGYGVKYDGEVWDFYEKIAVAKDSVPVGVVLTLAATGSEMSNSSVITNEEGWLKRGYSSDLGRPKFAIMNPELTYTLPEYQTMKMCIRDRSRIADFQVPPMPKTTFNIGVIEGGTSVNTIAENASMLVDIRSDSPEELKRLSAELETAVRQAEQEENGRRPDGEGVKAEIELVGNRPAGTQPKDCKIVRAAWTAAEMLGITPELRDESSTDANIPISLGIPAITVGRGGEEGGVHTIHEWFKPVDAYLGPQKNMLLILLLSGVEGVCDYQLARRNA